MKASVEILLSTYNGSEYLDGLLKSLTEQDYPNLKLTIRDDGSTDNTLNIIEKFADRLDLRVIQGRNIGPCESFFELIRQADNRSDYLALCDQDDIWLPAKISRAIDCLESENINQPLLYCSRQLITDKDLNIKTLSFVPEKPLKIGNALVQNVATGCTIVFNKNLRDLIVNRLPPAEKVIMHDWWVYIIASTFGKVVFDSQALILYRQHGANHIGSSNGIVRWLKRLKRLLVGGSREKLQNQALSLLSLYSEMLDYETKRRVAVVFSNAGPMTSKIKILFFDKFLYRQHKLDSFYTALILMSN